MGCIAEQDRRSDDVVIPILPRTASAAPCGASRWGRIGVVTQLQHLEHHFPITALGNQPSNLRFVDLEPKPNWDSFCNCDNGIIGSRQIHR